MPDQQQTVDFDTLILSALDARPGSCDRATDAAENAFKIACWMARRGVQITLDGKPFEPDELSPHSALRLIEDRGLFDEDVR